MSPRLATRSLAGGGPACPGLSSSSLLPAVPTEPSFKTSYTLPATTLKGTILVRFVSSRSSLKVTNVRLLRVSPVYAASIVSKLLPAVVIVTAPLAGAVQVHQTDLPPSYDGSHSPGSRVAPTLLPVVVKLVPTSAMRVAKLSLSGIAPWPTLANAQSAVIRKSTAFITPVVLVERRRAVGQVHRVGHGDDDFTGSLERLPAVRGADVVHKEQVAGLPRLAYGVGLVRVVDHLHE